MRIAAITTVNHNVGDDFVREGILYLLSRILPDLDVLQVHKHLPITARPECEWLYTGGYCRLLDRVPGLSGLVATNRLDHVLPLNTRTDKILTCDLLVQCGAPVYWLHGTNSCAQSEWYEPLIRRRWSMVRDRVPFLNLAGGACQAFGSDGSEFDDAGKTLEFIREFYDDCLVTTLRDTLASKILQTAGRVAPVLPCTSIFARFGVHIEPQTPGYVALNYMRTGGHYRFGKRQNPDVWENRFCDFVKQLPSDEKYVFICHSRSELKEANRLFPSHKTLWSKDYRDYLKFYAHAKYGIFNRVHAALALASFGRPSLVVGSDSRASMCETVGLKSVFVDDATLAVLIEEFQRLGQTWPGYSPVLGKLQLEAEHTYLELLKEPLRKIIERA
jgi:hypothetical protein